MPFFNAIGLLQCLCCPEVAPPQVWVGKYSRTVLGEDCESGVRFYKFDLRAKAGECGSGGQVGCLGQHIWQGGASWLSSDSPKVMGNARHDPGGGQ